MAPACWRILPPNSTPSLRNTCPRARSILSVLAWAGCQPYYLQRLACDARVTHFVSLAAPHAGTVLARLLARPGVLQMRRGSAFLRDLERDQDRLRTLKVTSLYTPLDLMIVPARSSGLPHARNIRIWALMHPSLILEKRCLRAVSAALAT